MNISMNNLNSTVLKASQLKSVFNNATLSNEDEIQPSNSDKMSISNEGKIMSKMLKHVESREEREAINEVFQSTYKELDIAKLDVENMTDEEIKEVLTAFEASMSEYMNAGYKPASEMNTTELKETLTNIKGMNEKMNGPKGQYGPPPGGGKGGPKGVKPNDQKITIDSEDEEETLISSLLEALTEFNEDEEVTVFR